ncbi:MAG: alkaline phosphatase family protein, partial [Candidatus Omnitrophica bacterium]|nr:alkaline phosphatase family protein [Candidatus Omnitrophota bacterium]
VERQGAGEGAEREPPIAAARVLLIYVDGLRLDVLLEMASGGFLPNLKRVFLDRGLLVPNAFSVFPSNTLIANGALFTGRFPDRTGIKSQNQFERATLKPIVQFSRWLPDGFFPQPHTRVINLLDKYAPENTHGFLIKRGVPTMATYLGKSFRWTTLPIAPLNPPPQWFHRAINTIGPLKWTSNLPWRLDTVNAQYAVEELIGDPDARVIAIWFPMLDKVSHHSPRGQFGAARRELALVDRYLGRILQQLKQVGWESSTYLILLSDHGHMGGKEGVNQICNLPRDWGHQVLGCNAKVVGQEWLHPGIDPSRILFFDNQGSGQAKLFLPYGSYWRGAWRRNRLYELTHYYLRPSQRSVNLLESLANFHPPHWNGDGPKPVDLILVKLDEERTLVYRGPSNQAIIYRTKGNDSQEYYRYEPVQQLWQSEDGSIEFRMPQPGVDPLGYLKDPHFLQATGGKQWLKEAHLANEWLHATFKTRYPDAVVLMAKFFAWSPPLKDLASLRDPDLLVTASEGWSFRSDNELGTDHGYPLADSMRITLSLSGPNIAHGALQNPQRIVDILPTVLQMVGKQYDTGQMDGELIAGIYE